MRFLSLFSGIEAASAAWHPIGWECVGVAEIEPFPCAVLKHHYPKVPNLGSVTDITEQQIKALGQIDLVVGGFPCQDLSVAGKRKGLRNTDGSQTRSGLFYDAMRIVQWTNARWLVLENVPGMFSSNQGKDFASVVGELLGCEFDVPRNGWENAGVAASDNGLVEWAVLDAQYFGVAQRRRRCFIIRDTGNWAGRPPIFLERHSLSGHPAPSRQARKGTASNTASGVGAGGWPAEVSPTLNACFGSKQGQENQHINGGAGMFVPVAFDAFNQAETGELSKTVASRNDQDTASLVAGCWWDGGDVAATITTKSDDQRMPDKANAQLVMQPIPIHDQATRFAGKRGDKQDGKGNGFGVGAPGDPSPTLTKGDKHAVAQPITFGAQMSVPQTDVDMVQTLQAKNPMAVAFGGDIARSLTARHDSSPCADRGMDVVAVAQPVATDLYNGAIDGDATHSLRVGNGNAMGGVPSVMQAMQVRRLTPVECERLQGFPDGYTNIPWRNKPESPDGPRYKALGNSMAVPCMVWIGERINEVSKL